MSIQELERAIVRALLESAKAQGCRFKLWSTDQTAITRRTDDVEEVMRDIQACDEELMVFTKDAGYVGSVHLVYGNDGWDVIANNTVSELMEAILKPAEKLADELESKHG